MDDHRFFESLAARTDASRVSSARAPARLKARIYSALVVEQATTGPLRSLRETKAGGRPLCMFENLLQTAVPAERVASMNPCRVCHARLLAERFEEPPIFWPNCPYVDFRKS
jgi:hypothetical protein